MDFKERIEFSKDQEILNIIKSKDDYQEEFWELCVLEAEKRKLQGIKQIIDELNNKKIEKEKEEREAGLLELYSERTIIIFSAIFTPLAGSILFALNLKRLKKKEIENVIGIGFLYTVIIGLIGILLPLGNMRSLGYLVNIVAGFVMIFQFSRKYYPDGLEYKNKNAFPAFILGFLIIIVIVFTIYAGSVF